MNLFILGFIAGEIVMGALLLYLQRQHSKKLSSILQNLSEELEENNT